MKVYINKKLSDMTYEEMIASWKAYTTKVLKLTKKMAALDSADKEYVGSEKYKKDYIRSSNYNVKITLIEKMIVKKYDPNELIKEKEKLCTKCIFDMFNEAFTR